MNIQSGGISFEISGTNKQLLGVLAESKKSIQEFQGAAVLGGKTMDAAFNRAAQSIDKAFKEIDVVVDTNKAAIVELEAEYKRLGTEAAKAMTAGRSEEAAAMQATQARIKEEIALRQTVINEAAAQADALLREEQSLRQQQQAAEKAAGTQQSLRMQLRRVNEQLGQMEEAGLRGTDTFRQLQREAGRLANAIGDAQTQARIFSHDNAGLQGMIAGLSGVAGAFSAAQGAVALFAGENENLQKIMLKVQALMSITMGLQQVANALNKDSAFMLVTVAKAKEYLTIATNKLSVALGVSTVAAKALMATLTLGLSVAITAVIVLWDKFSGAAKEAKKSTEATRKAFDEYHKTMASKSADLVGRYQRLRDEYGKLKTEADKQQWIKDNATEFNNLSLSVGNVTDADRVFVNNTASVIKALELRAKAMALQELQMKAYEEYYKTVINADQTVAGGGFYHKFKGEKQFSVNGSMPDEWKKAGVTSQEANFEWGGGQSGAGWYKPTQAAIDKINAYRIEQARATNKQIHDDATAELNKTTKYVKAQLALTEKEIEALGILKAGQGGGTDKPDKPENPKKDADPYAQQLAMRKQLYEKYLKWITSSDETVRNAAASEFAPLLKEGTSYLDYLEKQRAEIEGKAKKTALDLKNLATLNNEIANATKEAVLSAFGSELQQQLAQCKTISEMLAAIEQRRGELSGDNSDVDNAKAEMLNAAEDETKQKAQEETAALLHEYASYLQEKLEFEEAYARNRELLTKRAAEATTEGERRIAEAALAALEAKREEYGKRSGNEQYDQLLQEYKTYQEQQTDILKRYAEQRALAESQGNTEMIGAINAKQQAELSKLAAQRLMASESWGQLFSDISRLSTTTINRLLAQINSKKINLSAQFNPADLQAINAQLQKARTELQNRNPFLALRYSLAELRAAMKADKLLDSDDPFVKQLEEKKKQYQQYTEAVESDDATLAGAAKEIYAGLLAEGSSYVDMLRRKIQTLNGLKIKGELDITGEKELDILNAALNKEQGTAKSVGQGFKDAFGDIAGTLSFLSGTFSSVVSGIKGMGIAMDEETEAILGDIGGMLEGAGQLAQGIATANPLGIIQGAIGFMSSAFSLFNSRDRKAEKAIKKHEEAVTKLGNAYKALEHAVDNALGETVYKNQNALIQNLRQQQNEVRGMIEAEMSKKKTDWGKIEDYQERIREAERQIADIMEEITKSITQTSASELADQLKDALIDAFESGESAAKVFGDVANNVLKQAVANALKLQFLEKPLQAAIKQLQKDMGFDEEGNGTFDGLTQAEQERFKRAIQEAGANFQAAMDMYKDLFASLDDSDPSTLSGAIKGASQESIDLLAGQTNAVRQNQVVAIDIFRKQLSYLSTMDGRLAGIAGTLLNILERIPSGDTNDNGLRSQGITI